ncbi:B box and SPRY domain-containing protein [Melanotaenia boesemani]|uniref:B box and SPRY domain-containing protein n=1 Tax=Melanotaenia boesemani TaxID=1250792 RepID=UPI001C04FF31|nr:B box and SPRY domain-containing protein [Melanotaenia boesemani]XP_041826469.1 B box and SPRY domain-containing protein [Melanotaenia boesemani]
MTEEFTNCDLTCSSTPEETLNSTNVDFEQPIFSMLAGGMKAQQQAGPVACPSTCGGGGATSPTATTSDTESGIFSVEYELCVDHESELEWFCNTEQKLICSHCSTGSCHGHTVTRLASRVTAVRNQLVDVCEKIQLQALRIEKFIDQTLTAKEQKLQTAACKTREQVLAQISATREALEEEEQRLLEEVQREEERVEQCLLTQRAHWKQALTSLSQTRSRLVQMLTHTPDAQLAISAQEIAERVEVSEGVGEPCDTDQLNLNPACSDSKLLRGLWATALLLGPNVYGSTHLKFDERTVSPLLSLSDDLCTLTFLHKKTRESLPYDPARFDSWPNALGSPSMSSGTYSWVVNVGQSCAFKVGVCYASIERKGSGNDARLGYNSQSWVLSHYDGDYSYCHAGKNVPLQVVKRPQRIGLLLDWLSQTLLFYEPDSNAVLYSVTEQFSSPLLLACAVTDRSITILH